jgi:small neutral amino acid transporter SnatA (MarC family)
MSLLIGGAIFAVIGLVSLIFFWFDFINILKGSLPIFMLLGGALAVYVGLDEMQEKNREERHRQEEKLVNAQKEIETIKAQAESYKEELEKLKVSKS